MASYAEVLEKCIWALQPDHRSIEPGQIPEHYCNMERFARTVAGRL